MEQVEEQAASRKRKAEDSLDEEEGTTSTASSASGDAPTSTPEATEHGKEGSGDASASSSSSSAATPAVPPEGMSKKALKRLKKAEEMKVKRKYQRQQRKERKKKAKEELKKELQEKLEADPNTRLLPISKWKRKKQLDRERVVLPQRVVIDCSFDSLMTEREILSLVNQLARCYSFNNSSPQCLQLSFTSFGGNTEKRCKIALPGYENWTNITLEPRGYLDVFKKEELVYLTSESPNVIQTLDDDKVYIIGGLVDHNRLKGITYKIAQEQGIATAQLPIGEYLRMTSRKVLAVNHVFEILLRFKLTGDWEKTLLEIIPQRKGAQSKTAQQESEEAEDEGAEEEESHEKNQEANQDANEQPNHEAAPPSSTSASTTNPPPDAV